MFRPSSGWVDYADERCSAHTRPQNALLHGMARTRGSGMRLLIGEHTVKGYEKYSVRVEGSGRGTNRNMRFLGAYKPDNGTVMMGPDQH